VTITNIVGKPDEDDTWIGAHREECYNYPVVTMRRRIKAFFSETLELKDFPLDVQVRQYYLTNFEIFRWS
jgi:hypothetical protein